MFGTPILTTSATEWQLQGKIMNNPHIGKTISQRNAIRQYEMVQGDAVRQPEPANFCASDDATSAPPLCLVVLAIASWAALLGFGLVMVAVKWGWLS